MKSSTLKAFTSGVIVASIVSLSMSVFAESLEKQITVAYNNIKVSINGQQATLKDSSGNAVEPFTYNGTVYLPVRAVSQALGCTVAWDDTTSTVKLTSSSSSNSNTQSKDGTGTKPDASDMKEKVQTVLTSLVSAGTLTQEKADKVLTYFDSTGTEQSSSTTPTQGATMKADPISQAVTDGVITQAEADAIKKAMMPEGGQGGPGNAPGASGTSTGSTSTSSSK
jgi:Copper amine oxidase N-terminal domain.